MFKNSEIYKVAFSVILFCTLFADTLPSFCQEHHFTLKVHFDNPSIKTLEIHEAYFHKFKPYHAAEIKEVSSNVNENVYLFQGTILYPTAVRLYPSDTVNFNQLLFIDTGYQEISIIKKGGAYITHSNSVIEKEHNKFLNEMDIKTIDDQIDGAKLLSYVEKNSDSYVGLFAIINQAFRYPYPAIFEKINHVFAEKIKQTKAFQYYSGLYNPNSIGTSAPDFLVTSIDGQKISLSSFRNNNYVLLHFWASWCKYCREMTPYLKDLYQKYHKKGLEIIGISVDTDSTAWEEALKKEGVQSWINVMSESFFEESTKKPGLDMKYSVLGYPTNILINKEGVIVGRYTELSPDELELELCKKITELIK